MNIAQVVPLHIALLEIVKDGETGFIVNNSTDAVLAISKIENVSRFNCRQSVIENFTADKMAQRYYGIYTTLA